MLLKYIYIILYHFNYYEIKQELPDLKYIIMLKKD